MRPWSFRAEACAAHVLSRIVFPIGAVTPVTIGTPRSTGFLLGIVVIFI
ncbi:MAG: hypothetical protein JWR10_3806 [Rubritepida sp.]|nr:hypothetical protein [Rubritepida sp.]